MSNLTHGQKADLKLQEFLQRWPLEKVKEMNLEDYTQVGNKDTLSYWLEYETEILGRIGGVGLQKFGIWNKKDSKPIRTADFDEDDTYKWWAKYGGNSASAFQKVKALVIEIIEASQQSDFRAIDSIDLHSLAKWKIAFLYSNQRLIPIYKKESVRRIARHFEHPNYEKARFSELHTFINAKKPEEENLFDFALKYFLLTKTEEDRSYYILGSKYEDKDGNDTVDILPEMLERSVIATGYCWNEDYSHLTNRSPQFIKNWIDKNAKNKSGKFEEAKRTLSYFLNLKEGDLIAIKSHGQYGNLTIVAYAEVISKNGVIYEPDKELGQIVHVRFLENNLSIKTGLSYGRTIHKITPGEKDGHFEKIFGSYALDQFADTETEEDFISDEIPAEDRINEKDTSPQTVTVSYTKTLGKAHNKIQNAFARSLKKEFPNDKVRTESNYIDVVRINDEAIYYYEVKPFNSAYSCIRAGIGQLLDYYHSNPSAKQVHLCIVGPAKVSPTDSKFIDFIKSTLNLSFDYIQFPKK